MAQTLEELRRDVIISRIDKYMKNHFSEDYLTTDLDADSNVYRWIVDDPDTWTKTYVVYDANDNTILVSIPMSRPFVSEEILKKASKMLDRVYKVVGEKLPTGDTNFEITIGSADDTVYNDVGMETTITWLTYNITVPVDPMHLEEFLDFALSWYCLHLLHGLFERRLGKKRWGALWTALDYLSDEYSPKLGVYIP